MKLTQVYTTNASSRLVMRFLSVVVGFLIVLPQARSQRDVELALNVVQAGLVSAGQDILSGNLLAATVGVDYGLAEAAVTSAGKSPDSVVRPPSPLDCFLAGFYEDSQLRIPSRCDYITKSYNVNTFCPSTKCNTGSTPIRTQTEGPAQLQGIFWLKGVATGSILASFAKTNEGGVVSSGKLKSGSCEYAYRIRVAGDRIWSFGAGGVSDNDFTLVYAVDLVYNIVLVGGTVKNPTELNILPDVRIPDSCYRFEVTPCLADLFGFKFNMKLNTAKHSLYPNSKVWTRKSYFLGQLVDTYEIVQIVDGKGNKLQPAYNDWKTTEIGRNGGVNVYRELGKTNTNTTCPLYGCSDKGKYRDKCGSH